MMKESHKVFYMEEEEELAFTYPVNVEKFGFSSAVEFVIYHWSKLPESSRERLKSVGISPKLMKGKTDDFRKINKE